MLYPDCGPRPIGYGLTLYGYKKEGIDLDGQPNRPVTLQSAYKAGVRKCVLRKRQDRGCRSGCGRGSRNGRRCARRGRHAARRSRGGLRRDRQEEGEQKERLYKRHDLQVCLRSSTWTWSLGFNGGAQWVVVRIETGRGTNETTALFFFSVT